MPAWLSYLAALIPGVLIVLVAWRRNVDRLAINLSLTGTVPPVLKALLLSPFLLAAVFYLECGRGIA